MPPAKLVRSAFWEMPLKARSASIGSRCLAVDDLVEIGKGVTLRREIVDLRRRRGHRVDAVFGAEKIAADVIIIAVDRAAVFDARLQRLIAAAVDRNRAAGREH